MRAATPAQRLAAIKRVVERKQYERVGGFLLDLTTASAMLEVYNGLSEQSRIKFLSKPIAAMAEITWKLVS